MIMKKLLTTASLFVVPIVAMFLFTAPPIFGQEKKTADVNPSLADSVTAREVDWFADRAILPRPRLTGTRVLVRYDMEGMAGQDDWRSASAWWPKQYAMGQALLAKDVNAVIAGLFDGGAAFVDVIDQHGSGNPGFNLPQELLDRRVGTHFHRHDSHKVEAIKYDAVVMVAMHAKTGSGGFMAHTNTFGIEQIINDRPVSEAELGAYSWGESGIPVIFVSGDDRLRDDLLEVMPWLEYVVTKRAISAQGVNLRPVDVVRGELRAGARRALARLPEMKPLRARRPVRAGVRAVPPADLSVLQHVPGINYADGQVSFEAATYADAVRGMNALQLVAVEMGGRPYVDEIFKRSSHWSEINRAIERGFWEAWIALEADRPRGVRRPR